MVEIIENGAVSCQTIGKVITSSSIKQETVFATLCNTV